jgi:hypothetical protein
MLRVIVCALFIGVWPSFALAQAPHIFCRFDDSPSVVVCIDGDESNPVFHYEIADADVGLLAKLSSSITGRVAAGAQEQCRAQAEEFRTRQLEDKLNNSLEGLRTQAESIRASSDANLLLYKQIMLVYEALLARYKSGLQTYQNSVRACHVTPYEVRPDRI